MVEQIIGRIDYWQKKLLVEYIIGRVGNAIKEYDSRMAEWKKGRLVEWQYG